MGNHKWENFSNPRNRRVSVIGCIKCGAMKGSAAEKRGGDCVATSLEKSTLIRMGWTVVGSKEVEAIVKVNDTLRADAARTAVTGWSTLYDSKFKKNKGVEAESLGAVINA